jgi:hypothetical protein
MTRVEVIAEAQLPADGLCWCGWRADRPCPHRAEWRVQHTTNDGDRQGSAAPYPGALGRDVWAHGGDAWRVNGCGSIPFSLWPIARSAN